MLNSFDVSPRDTRLPEMSARFVSTDRSSLQLAVCRSAADNGTLQSSIGRASQMHHRKIDCRSQQPIRMVSPTVRCFLTPTRLGGLLPG
jgi:hypothetical protein